MKKLSQLFIFVSLGILCGCSTASKTVRVNTGEMKRSQFQGDIVNAGIVYSTPTGGEDGVAKSFPFSSSIVKEKNLNGVLKKRFETVKRSGCKIITEDLASTKQGAISVALSIDSETHRISYINGIQKYKLEVIVNAAVVLFDFNTKSVLATYPFMITYADNYSSKPSADIVRGVYEKIFSDVDFSTGRDNINIFTFAANILQNIAIYKSYASTIGVKKIELDPVAENSMKELGFGRETAKSFVANLFNGAISKNFKIPMLPYSYGNSEIFYVMADGYREGDKLSNDLLLKVPNPTYSVSLSLEKLSYKLKQKENSSMAYIFVSRYKISVFDIENVPVFTGKIAKGNSEVFTSQYNDKPMHLTALFYNFIQLFNSRTSERLNGDEKFAKFVDILEKCK